MNHFFLKNLNDIRERIFLQILLLLLMKKHLFRLHFSCKISCEIKCETNRAIDRRIIYDILFNTSRKLFAQGDISVTLNRINLVKKTSWHKKGSMSCCFTQRTFLFVSLRIISWQVTLKRDTSRSRETR